MFESANGCTDVLTKRFKLDLFYIRKVANKAKSTIMVKTLYIDFSDAQEQLTSYSMMDLAEI